MEYHALARKYLGEDYAKMTPQDRLACALEYSPFSPGMNARLVRLAQATGDNDADELAAKVLQFYDDLPSLAKELKEIREKHEKNTKA